MVKTKAGSYRKPRRILFLITILTIGGAPKAILRLARGLKKKGCEVLVVTLYSRRNSVPIFAEQFGVTIIDLEMKSEESGSPIFLFFSWIRGITRLYKLMRFGRYDVLQTFIESSNIIGPVLGWLAGIPVRVTSQRATLVYKSRWYFWIDSWITNSFFVDKMVAVSENTRQFCIYKEKINPQKLLTIYNGVDSEEYSPLVPDRRQGQRDAFMKELGLNPDKIIVTSVGRLHEQKGYDILLRAIPDVVQVFQNVVFLIVGDGRMKEELNLLHQSLGLDNVVYFLGIREDIPEILAVSDLFVLPSRWEGFPNALLEAMSAGLATVATAIDGSKELIEDGENGILVPLQYPDELGKAIIGLLEDEKKRQKISIAARQRVINGFSEKKYIDNFAILYENLFRLKTAH
jgi:glycosyltransferase involved in cell wall biosynthesis